MKNFIGLMEKELIETGYKLLDNHERSRAFVLSKNKECLKIKRNESRNTC